VKRILILLLLIPPTLAGAWGRQGHMTIALVAEGLMTPAAKQMVDELRRAPGWEGFEPGDSRYFKTADEELTRFCQGPEGGLSLVGDWADAWRERHPETGPLHFVNTPLDGDGSVAAMTKACGDGCILTKLDQEILVLGDRTADRTRRLEALLWVVHLVGDIHQPLHCSDNGDKGGNAVGVFVEGRIGNLHLTWDTGFFYVEHARPKDLAADLLSHECKDVAVVGPIDSQTPWVWARESYGVAKDFVYPQVQRNGGEFSRAEVDLAWPVVRRQLARAGVRLAAVLNGAARE
jgi:hypothetical protein